MPHRLRLSPKSRLLSSLRSATRGATAPLIAASILPIFGAMGGAIDLANIYMVRSQMRDAVDNAALAGGRLFGETDRDVQVANFFNSNFPALANGNTLHSFNVSQAAVGGVNQFTVTAQVDVKLLLMRVFGWTTHRVSATATVERGSTGIELVLALDNTDSMNQDDGGGTTRIQALRTASLQLVTTLYGGNENNPNLLIGIIPYTSMVNVGKMLIDEGTSRGVNYIEPLAGYSYDPAQPLGWKGCLDESPTDNTISASSDPNSAADWTNALDTKELAPGVGGQPLFRPFLSDPYDRRDSYMNDPGVSCSMGAYNTPGSWKGGIEGEATSFVPSGPPVYSPPDPKCKPKAADPSAGYSLGSPYGNRFVKPGVWPTGRYSNPWWLPVDPTAPAPNLYPSGVDPSSGGTPNLYCPQASINLKARSKTEVDAFLSSMTAYNFSAGTMSNVAMGWAYRMLTPAAPLVAPPKSSARPKVIILMTDGFLWQDPNMDWRSPYGYVAENKLVVAPAQNGTTFDTAGWRQQRYDALAARMQRWCVNARAEGIRVYTIAFTMPATDPRGELYRQCATEPGMYYNASNAAALTAAFTEIATSLASLRLVK